MRRYEGKDIAVTYDVARCIHAAECVRGLPAVFDTARRPWVDADGAPADEVAEVVARCPTGALHFERRDGGEEELVPDEVSIRVMARGPLYVSGPVKVVGDDGEVVVEDTRVALCRCGGSSNKPFCDGTHTAIGFGEE